MKSNTFLLAAGAAVLAVALLGCQTAKPALVTPAPSSIEAGAAGFSPKGGADHDSIQLALKFGNGDAVASWKVELTTGGKAQKSWSGDAKYLPSSLTWDGTTDGSTPAPEGSYIAGLSITYTKTYEPVSVQSKSFILDITPPTGSITLDPPQFTATGTGVASPVTLALNAQSALAKMDTWSLDVYDTAGSRIRSWNGKWPDASVSWDGTSSSGTLVVPAMSYSAVATVRDEFGNSAQLKTEVPVTAAAVAAAPAPVAPPAAAPAPPPLNPAQSGVQSLADGFSPLSETMPRTIGIELAFGNKDSIKSWQLSLIHASMGVQKTWTGDASSTPTQVSWDGSTDKGGAAPEGSYTATLAIDYGTAFAPASVTSRSFILDRTPPSGSIALSAPLFSPIENTDTITLTLNATSPVAAISSWSMDLNDPGGNLFRSFTGKWPSNTAVWDGKGAGGEMVQSAEDYPVIAKVYDQFGNTAVVKSTVPIDILVEKTATGYRILASRIWFKAYTADYKDVSAELATQNSDRLDALATKLAKFPGYKIRIVGHAVMIHWNDPVLGKAEQEQVLIPLSKARAEAIMQALVARGLDASRFTTQGVGASDQLVPDSDYRDQWQNRRVALFLERE